MQELPKKVQDVEEKVQVFLLQALDVLGKMQALLWKTPDVGEKMQAFLLQVPDVLEKMQALFYFVLRKN